MSLHLRALVSGIPEPTRRYRLLFMLQALIDESQSHEDPRVFVLAGYIATVQGWEKLTAEWKRILGGPPRLEYFSFREAYPASGKPSGQFNNMTLQERDDRVAAFRVAIEDHLTAEVGLRFSLDAYEKAFVGIKDMERNPYYFANIKLDVGIAENMERMGLERGPIEFIYDDRKREEPRILDAWFYAREHGPAIPDLFETVLTTAPSFRSSRKLIALQSADLLAGAIRWFNVKGLKGLTPAQPFPGQRRVMQGMFMSFTDEQLQATATRIKARNNTTS